MGFSKQAYPVYPFTHEQYHCFISPVSHVILKTRVMSSQQQQPPPLSSTSTPPKILSRHHYTSQLSLTKFSVTIHEIYEHDQLVESNGGSDSFQNYGKGSNGADVGFTGYDKSDNSNSDKFIGYGKGGEKQRFGFSGYRINSSFAEYAKHGVKTFASYKNESFSGVMVKKWVEEGKFFREFMLKEGTVMAMPDIRDKMPQRSFLPRVILSKLPFTVNGVNRVFGVGVGSSLEKIVMDSVSECERAPSEGETKRCVGSIEDMVDFATGVLGSNVVVRTTENVKGSKGNVMVGRVNGINGGRVTESVSCHQSLFPYLLYYCHSVPKVRVYEADLLDPKSKAKINRGVAICHLDTSSWSPSHGAFLALGSGPGQIEVCHWIFENDMTWTMGD
ncbi:hypothetical protein DEO72_LG7g2782 [Vigna unguiculata]|uniref:BURP domain-containing protein n=1 Tax=Vigna unguiculata TaxID=3917 RepID=A0A4D6MNU3_VIGUN|nr:hypothetical protein DEO72_LG7g2782 [Vigna unguiculata]